MKVIEERDGIDRFLEIVLSEREIKLLISHHLITCNAVINGKIHHVGIRSLSLREIEEDEDAPIEREE